MGRKTSDSGNQVLEIPDGKLGPDLPPANQIFPKGGEWLPLVAHWYEEYRRSPNASMLRSAPSWMAAQLGFATINEMLSTRRYATLMPVVRQLFDELGWTPASMRALKFDVPEADDHAASDGSNHAVIQDIDAWRRKIEAAG